MKTTVKAVIAVVLAVAAAFAMRAMYNVAAVDSSGENLMDVYQNMMVESRTMFVEKADAIQMAAAALLETEEAAILRGSDGSPRLITAEGDCVPPESLLPGELQPWLDEIFAPYECGGTLYNVQVTPKAIFFFTGYHESGSVGFLYERELGTVQGFNELLELSENWKIFYNVPEE